MYKLIKDCYFLNRTAVNPDTDKFVDRISSVLECSTLEIPSGKECLTWFIPKNWNVREGYLARLDGTRIVDFHSNPLHLWSHSVSFQGEVSRQELEQHLFSDPQCPQWVPYHYRNGYQYDSADWGFSLSHEVHQQLSDDRYQVHIDTDLDNNGSMKVVDSWLKGEYPDTIFIAAHTCHPGQVTDGISCVAAAVEVFQELRRRQSLRYSYRLILGPEYFAAAGFLATVPESEVQLLRNGIFLDMLGNNQKLAYQSSYQGDSLLDRVVQNMFTHSYSDSQVNDTKHPYRHLVGNDEMFYNGPGYLIPTIGIAGEIHPEYHFDRDDLDVLDIDQLTMSLEVLLKLIEVLETDFVPLPSYRGPLYLSRYGLYVDGKLDRQGYDNIEHIQILMDGERTCFDISHELGIDFFFVRDFCDQISGIGLLEKRYKNSYA